MAADPSFLPASVSRSLALAGFPRHAPHQPVGFHVETPGTEHPEATARLRWHGDQTLQAHPLDAVRTYLVWSGRPARPGRDQRGPYVLVLDPRYAAAGDMVLPTPNITPGAAHYAMAAAERPMAAGMSAAVVAELARDARRKGLAVYQLPDGEIRIGHTRLIPEPEPKA